MALLVDNDGTVLNYGIPTHQPPLGTKQLNWNIITESKDTAFKADMISACEWVWRMDKREL